jgi:peptidyl-prolyl cis-trans isomerase SurA
VLSVAAGLAAQTPPAPEAASQPATAPSGAPATASPNPSGARHSMILERVLVRVNGDILTQSELVQRQTDELRNRNVDPRNMTDATVLKMLNEVTPNVLFDTISDMLLVQRGRELGLKFTDEAFKDGLENIKKDNKLDDAALRQVMAQQGLTMDDLRTNFEREYMKRQVINEEVYRRMHVTEEELRQYYAAHRDQFTTPENITLRELFVMAPTAAGADVTAADNAAAKTKIDAIRARAVAGEDFEALVTSSSDAANKGAGGRVGPLNLSDINPIVKDAVAGLKIGDISQPIEMPRGGYEIFKVEARETPVVQPFEKVKPEIEQKIRESRLDGELNKLLTRLREQAVIEWKDNSYRQLYEKRVAEGTGAYR